MTTKLARKKLYARTKRAIRHMSPKHIVTSRFVSSTIRRFAEKVGMVYFGTIHRNDEELRLIRGHTVSRTHIDNHYSVGSLRGYDVAMVLRNDIILTKKDHHEQRCHWLILTVDLHSKLQLPHIYIGHRLHSAAFIAAFEQLTPLYIGALGAYPQGFLKEYTVYGRPTYALEVERAIPPQVTEVILSHFEGTSIEIEDNTVYMYLESARPSEQQLEKLLSNGVWLAEAIDTNVAALYCEVPKKQ